MSAILREDPPDPSTLSVNVPPAVLRTLRRCLEKRPQERFESARDLAFALESALDSSSMSGGVALPPVRSRRWLYAAVAALAFGIAGGFAAARLLPNRSAESTTSSPLQFHRLTYNKGTIRDARFMPDGQSIIYGAAWTGNPLKLFMVRTDSPESAPLSLPDARLLSISKTGELALSLNHTYEGWMGEGTLARSSALGSAPRVMVEHVREAEWTPDGSDLAVVRRVEGLERLELPLGKVLYQTSGYISDIRFSPSGDRIAFADHPVYADDAGTVTVMDRDGHRTVLSEGWTSIQGIAWTRDGGTLLFGASQGRGGTLVKDGVYAVTLDGKLRPLIVGPTTYKVLDIASDGRVLLNLERAERGIEALMADSPNPVNIELGSNSSSQWVANDGKSLLIADQSTPSYDTYLLKAGGAPVHLGTGGPIALSPDGRWALAQALAGYPLYLHPTGPGQSRTLSDPENIAFDLAGWLDDAHIVGFGQKQGQRSRGYVRDINGGAPRPFTAEGVHVVGGATRWWTLAISPDGTRVIAAAEDGTPMIYRVDGGAPEPIRNLRPGELPVQWTPDGRGVLVAHGNGLPWTIERQDLASGQRSPAATIRAHDQAGLRLSIFEISRDAKYYVHTYSRLLSDLYVVDGLK